MTALDQDGYDEHCSKIEAEQGHLAGHTQGRLVQGHVPKTCASEGHEYLNGTPLAAAQWCTRDIGLLVLELLGQIRLRR